ncbi:MAG: SET domain-containing protein [Rubrobacteraceae bacterium]|nr:SET domain-containing protein [Rubrobacteraceae bacterium]MBA3637409.1 SET domain-containing protein [Rubrobacteraceae bacterium]
MFAREPILAGEVVEIIGGTLMTQAEFETFLASAKRFSAVQIAEDMHLVERTEVIKARGGSVNHSCDPNLWMADEATVVARRDIGAGEELTSPKFG